MPVASTVFLDCFGSPAASASAAARALSILLLLFALFAVARRASRRQQLRHVAQQRRPPPTALPQLSPPSPSPHSGGGGVVFDRVLLRRVVQLLRLCVPRAASVEALLMLLLAALLALRTGLTLTLARTIGRNGGALVAREGKAFLFGVADLAVYAVPATVTTVGIRYAIAALERRFRARAQAALHAEYFYGSCLYNIASSGAVDNPAQRVTTDMRRFCRELADLLPALLKPLMDIAMFTATLARLGGCAAPALVLSYYALAAALFRAVLPNFMSLVERSRGKEGSLRTMHTQIVQHAEEVAFYRGAEVERGNADRLLHSFARMERYIKRVKWWTTLLNALFLKYGATCVGYAACAIAVCRAQGKVDAVALTQLHVQSTQLYIPLSLAVGRLLSLHLKVGALCSSAHRVGELREALHILPHRASDASNTRSGTIVELAGDDRVVLRDVAIVSPADHVLVSGLTLEFAAGRHVLVTGGNGAGKTALLRTVAGLWPLRRGVVERPPLGRLMFLTQRVYLPPGTLRGQLIYPALDNKDNRSHNKDEELLGFAAAVGLAGVIEREGGLDAVKEWGEVLSGGERQRVALVRVLVHRPAFAFLDECTSAVSQDVELELYACLRRAAVTLVTVSHRESLRTGHVEVLDMDGMGGYIFQTRDTLDMGPCGEKSREEIDRLDEEGQKEL